MRLVAQRLENVGWVALVFVIAILLYPLSLRVATLRGDIVETEEAIVRAEERIRYLETEFRARASHAQLESWNAMEFGYAAPRPDQFLEGEEALAGFGEQRPGQPRMTLVATMDGVKPGGIIGSVFGSSQQVDTPEEQAAIAAAENAAKQNRASKKLAAMTHTERVAQLERMLVDDEVLNSEDGLGVPAKPAGNSL